MRQMSEVVGGNAIVDEGLLAVNRREKRIGSASAEMNEENKAEQDKGEA